MDFIIWILFGLLVGWVANSIMHVRGKDFFKNLIIGLLGAFIGGFIGQSLFSIGGIGPFTISGFIFSLIGAILLIWLLRKLRV
jgi:uncharacterized membrane protein YeaQ/YmgE (transglycosylase-associated protein family)